MGACATNLKHTLKDDQSLAEHTFSISIKSVYEFKEFCGSGHYGTVCRAALQEDSSQICAIKKISKDFIRNTDHLRQEVDILCGLHHPNIIKLYETYQDASFFYIVMQYCSGGTLYSRINEHKKFTEKDAAVIVEQMIRAVKYLHRKGICHRDIKPENFLFASDKPKARLKLIDFGISHKLGRWFKQMNEMVGTVYYVAPEVISGSYDEKCDNWSIGVIMYLIITGHLPFHAKSEDLTVHRILHSEVPYELDIWTKVSPEGRDLVQRLLCKCSENRISMEEAHRHPWFQKQFKESDSFCHIKSFAEYAYKEESAVRITNQLLNNFSYSEIKKIAESLQKNKSEHMTILELEEKTKCVFEIQDKILEINARKLLKGTLFAKQHLNEERIWKAFQRIDDKGEGFIYFSGLQRLVEGLEGKNKRSFQGLGRKGGFSFSDVMAIFDNGRGLQD